jgi:alternate signal-mediated exported protein
MNKMIKGSIAGATGVALLMGGFGTYALWSDSENLAANGVQSGELSVDTSAGQWDDVNTAAANDWTASDMLVPGDKVSYTQTFAVKGSGKNLQGTVALATAALGGDFAGLVRTVEVTSDNATIVRNADKVSFTFSDPFGSATLTAVVTYELPASTSGTTDQNKTATTPASTFTIAQS